MGILFLGHSIYNSDYTFDIAFAAIDGIFETWFSSNISAMHLKVFKM
jgi:hypothetical protein